jgi:HEPN domain-containing protein
MTSNKDFLIWLKYSEDDLKLAKLVTTTDNPDMKNACYHCQQCAEKALKAFLISNNIKFKFIHDLEELCLDCQDIDPTFKQISANCSILNDYATVTRYPSTFVFVEALLVEAIELTEEILEFVKEKTIF